MKGLKENYMKCAHQIIWSPLYKVPAAVFPSRPKFSVQELFSKPAFSKTFCSTNPFQFEDISITKYCGALNQKVPNNNRKKSDNYIISKRNVFQETPRDKKPLPKLLYIQNPIVWLSNKIDFRFLRYTWDPTFSEEEFSRGARQAVSTVTQLVSKNMFESVKPLLTKNALLNLRRDVEILWSDEVRRNIGLNPEDVQLIIPRKIYFRNSAEIKLLNRGTNPAFIAYLSPKQDALGRPGTKLFGKKFCDIDVLFIGMKWLESHAFNSPLVFIDIVSRFHRNYSEGVSPDWTISAFKVRRFNLIPQKS